MNIRSLAAGLLVAVTLASAATAQRSEAPVEKQAGLSCEFSGNESQAARERQAIRAAPAGVKRMSDHVLQVSAKSGVRRFVDKRPYREELSGFHWLYCGYVAALDAHLIGTEDEDLFSGKLFLGQSGRLLDAGRAVYPSPDGKLFLAASQHDGKYLEDWILSDLTGRRLWAGDAGVTRDAIIRVQYENPRWISGDALKVTAVCDDHSGTRGEATLIRDGKAWSWRSSLQCKA